MLEMPFIVVFTVSSSVQSIIPSYKGYQTLNSPYSTTQIFRHCRIIDILVHQTARLQRVDQNDEGQRAKTNA